MNTTIKTADLRAVREKLWNLSCLGNGDKPGNSTGNAIAQEALAILDAALAQPEQEPAAICCNCLGTKRPHALDPEWKGRCECAAPVAQTVDVSKVFSAGTHAQQGAAPVAQPKSPISFENGNIYLNFNSIEIGTAADGGISVKYLLGGKPVCVQTAEMPRFALAETLTIGGVEGRICGKLE